MDHQAKKRGRKRKAVNEDIREFISKPTEPFSREPIKPIAAKHNKRHEIDREKIKSTRVMLVSRILSKSEKIDKIMGAKSFRDSIFTRMSQKKSQECLEEQCSDLHDEIYNKLREKRNTKDEFYIWQQSISYKMCKRLTEIAEFILRNGVMSKTDKTLLNDVMEGLMSYYKEKLYLLELEDEKDYILKTTYIPEKDSTVFGLLFKNNDFLSQEQVERFFIM